MSALGHEDLTAEQPPPYKEMLHPPEEVDRRVYEMAGEIIERYPNRDGVRPLFVCLMRGGVPFMADLARAIAEQDPHYHPEVDYMVIRTYGDERVPKPPELITDLSPGTEVEGRPVIIVDDIFHTGVTMQFAHDLLEERGAASVDGCVLISRTEEEHPPHITIRPTMVCFETPLDDWLTCSGLDDSRIMREANRWAGGVAVANSADEV